MGIIRSDSRGRDWRGRARKWAADRLFAAARRLDPGRPDVARNGDGSHTITVGDISLAKITPGMVQTERLPWPDLSMGEAQAAVDREYRRNIGR